MADLPDLTLPLPAPDLVARVNATEDRVAALEADSGTSGAAIQVGGSQPAEGWWLDNEIPDTTPPVAGTLAASDETHDGFTLTVTGASDAGRGLHAQPYRFSTDNGSSYGAWQAGSSWLATGLTAETTYQCRVEVRDAAGNTATAAANATTTAVPAETDPPIPGVLAASAVGKTTFTLTVTGASDAGVGLHAQPYAFSLDNGSTWTAWQADAVYAATGRTVETTYDCVHRVRDAAGNIGNGSAIEVTTLAADAADVIDTFTRSDGSIDGSTTEVGGLTWAKDVFGIAGGAATDYAPTISANKIISDAAGTTPHAAYVVTPTSHARARLSYTADSGVLSGAKVKLTIASGPITPGVRTYFSVIYQPKTNGAYVTKADGGAAAVVGSVNGAINVLAGTIEIEWDGTTLTARHNDAVVYTGAQSLTSPGTAVGVGFDPQSGMTADDLQITYLA